MNVSQAILAIRMVELLVSLGLLNRRDRLVLLSQALDGKSFRELCSDHVVLVKAFDQFTQALLQDSIRPKKSKTLNP